MSFFGLSSVGKDARGQMNELPNWYKAQFQDQLGRGNDSYKMGSGFRDQYAALLQQALASGYDSPEQLLGYGRQALPGVDDAIQRMNGRLGSMRDQYGNVPQGWQTADTIDSNLDLAMGSTLRNGENIRDMIDSGYGSAYGRADTAYGDIAGSLGSQGQRSSGIYGQLRGAGADTYTGAIGDSNTMYNALLGGSDNTIADLQGGNAGAYGKASANVERLLPGGDLAAARVARAYAPQMVSALGRLRQAGVDPTGLQGQGIIAQVERDRARGMDEALSNNLNQYVGAQNELTLGQEANRRGLALSGLQNRQGLAERQLGNRQGLSLSSMYDDRDLVLGDLGQQNSLAGAYRDLVAANASNKQGLDLSRMQAQVGNVDTAYQRSMGNLDARNNAAVQRRNMGIQDWQNQSGILDAENRQELTNLGLQEKQYNLGNEWAGNNLNQRNWATSNMGGLANNELNRAQQYNQQAMGWGDRAYQGYNNTYNREQQNAGWGTKMLMGAGLAAASLIPGVGPAISAIGGGAMRGAFGGGGQQGGQGGYGGGYGQQGGAWQGWNTGYGTPPYLPSFQTGGRNYPMSSQGGYYDPSKTRTLQNGDLQVGRY